MLKEISYLAVVAALTVGMSSSGFAVEKKPMQGAPLSQLAPPAPGSMMPPPQGAKTGQPAMPAINMPMDATNMPPMMGGDMPAVMPGANGTPPMMMGGGGDLSSIQMELQQINMKIDQLISMMQQKQMGSMPPPMMPPVPGKAMPKK